MGNKNNLVSVRQSDFEVFQALAKDIEEGNNNEQKEYTQVGWEREFRSKTLCKSLSISPQ